MGMFIGGFLVWAAFLELILLPLLRWFFPRIKWIGIE
jgi:hypothetical protein